MPLAEKRLISLRHSVVSRLNNFLGRVRLVLAVVTAPAHRCLLRGRPDLPWALGILDGKDGRIAAVLLGQVIVVHRLAVPKLRVLVFGSRAELLVGVAKTALEFICFVLEIEAGLFAPARLLN